MKSTGEVMGIDHPSDWPLPSRRWPPALKCPSRGGFLSASMTRTRTGSSRGQGLCRDGISDHRHGGYGEPAPGAWGRAETILKVSEGRPNVVDRIKNGDIQLVINVSLGRRSSRDAYTSAGVRFCTTCCTRRRSPAPGRLWKRSAPSGVSNGRDAAPGVSQEIANGNRG